MNLLIVDDEPKIRNGLCRHFTSSNFGFNTIETAENGIIAIDKTRAMRPDIVLADICMPGMDGFEFLDTASREFPNMKAIIISGHDDFSYAQKAIRYGVKGYVLKPIDLSQLDSLMKKVCGEIQVQTERINHTSFVLDIVDKRKDVLINDLVMRIINGDIEKNKAESEAKHLGITIPDPAGFVSVRIAEKLPQNNLLWSPELRLFAIRNIIDELCQHLSPRFFFTDTKQNLMLLHAYNSRCNYISLQNEILRAIELYVGYSVKIDTTVIKDTYTNLRAAYNDALGRLYHINEYSQIVLEAKNYIEQNYYKESLSLQDVAEAIQANPSYLSKLMSKQTGMSFVDYLTSVRMKMALILLRNSEKDVKLYEISQKLGYSSQHYFSRVFSKYYGVAPIQYRMKKGDENDA